MSGASNHDTRNDWRSWLERVPDGEGQRRLLAALRTAATPVLQAHQLRLDFLLKSGRANAARFGSCRQIRDGRPPVITIRCVRAEGGWRTPGAIAATFFHEAAHLKYLSHGPRFWGMLRRLLTAAERDGLYLPEEDDPTELRRGESKLAGSPAHGISAATSQRRQLRYQANRTAMESWQVGQTATVSRGPSAGTRFVIVEKLRSRVVVKGPDGRRFLIPAAFLSPIGEQDP